MCSDLKRLNFVPQLKNFQLFWVMIPAKKSVTVSCDPRHRKILFGALGLSTSITNSMTEGHMVNLHAIVSRLLNKRTYGVTDNKKFFFGLALCFMGEFLLCSRRPSFMDARA